MPFIKTNIYFRLQNSPLVKKLEKLVLKFRIYIRKNSKLNKLIINFGKLYNMVSVFSKNLIEKTFHSVEYLINLCLDYMNYLGIYIIDFIIESPTSIIDLIVYSDQLTKMELGRVFCLICIIVNTIRIIFFLKRLPCDVFYCPYYIRGYQMQRKIIQKLYIRLIFTILVCSYFTAQTITLRLVNKITNVAIYKRQVLVYFLLVVIWYDLTYKVWFFKRNNSFDNYLFRAISVEKFKKTLKHVFSERYNNRKYNQPNFKNHGNISVLKTIKTAGKKDIIVRIRFLNSIKSDISGNHPISNKHKKWERMDYQFYRKIVKSLNRYRLNPKFLSIFWGINSKIKKDSFNTDFILSNWNLFFMIVILSFIVIEAILEYKKKKQNYEKTCNINRQ